MKATVTIRMGAAVNSLFILGEEIPIPTDKTKRYEMRRDLIEGLKRHGYFGKQGMRRAA